MVVEREKEIRAFDPKDYWEVHATFRAAAGALSSPKMGTEAVAPLLYDLVMLHRGRVLRHPPEPIATALKGLKEGPKNP